LIFFGEDNKWGGGSIRMRANQNEFAIFKEKKGIGEC
jgi:hypothetical protein